MSTIHIGASRGESSASPLITQAIAPSGSGGAYGSVLTATATNLGIGGNYQGVATFVNGCRRVVAVFMSAQASAAGGAKLQMSSDNTNWFDCGAGLTIAANVAQQMEFPAVNGTMYYRLNYTNGGVAQTQFYAALIGYDV